MVAKQHQRAGWHEVDAVFQLMRWCDGIGIEHEHLLRQPTAVVAVADNVNDEGKEGDDCCAQALLPTGRQHA